MDSETVGPLYKFWLTLRSSLFWFVFLPSILVTATLLSLLFFLPIRFRVSIVKGWIFINLFWIKITCGLSHQIEGLENIPVDKGFIIMSKHSSTWETISLQIFFQPLVWIVKRELLKVPFFGWGLWAMDAIAINRGSGRAAIKQLIKEGRQRMDEGRIVMIFPEGTRVMPLQQKPYKLGGAILAEQTGYPILPVAHNAGEYWPRHSWIKWPGTIKVVIGKPIDPAGKKPDQIINEVQDWISSTGESISDNVQLKRLGLIQT